MSLPLPEQIAELNKQLDTAKAEKATLESKQASEKALLEKQIADANAAKATAETALASANAAKAEAEKQLTAKSERVVALEKENAALASKEQDIERRASAKADEAMAAVGFVKPTPSAPKPEAEMTLTDRCLAAKSSK